jgi:hypothetical protein
MGEIADTMRQLAQADARLYRGLAEELGDGATSVEEPRALIQPEGGAPATEAQLLALKNDALQELCAQRGIKVPNRPRKDLMVGLLLADPSGSAGAIGGRSEERWCGLVIVPPTGRRPVGGALAPVAAVTSLHQGLPVGCLWFTHDLSTAAQKPSAWAWQGRKGDHVWEKRCSGLDLLGCDPGSGTTAQDLRTRETELAYRSLLLRDDVRAAPSSSTVVCRIVGAPPLCAPARVIPGRTLLEDEGRVGSRATPQLQGTPLFSWRWPAGVPVPVPGKTQLVQCS